MLKKLNIYLLSLDVCNNWKYVLYVLTYKKCKRRPTSGFCPGQSPFSVNIYIYHIYHSMNYYLTFVFSNDEKAGSVFVDTLPTCTMDKYLALLIKLA